MKYLSYYDSSDKEGRSSCLSATNKMNYICKSLVSLGETVEIVSASMASRKGNFKGRREKISDGVTLKMFPAFKFGNIIQKLRTIIASRIILFFYLLFCVKRNEKILVYHSLSYMRALRIAKFLKGFKIILEVEEIYGDVKNDDKITKRELSFFKIGDSYVFPTILLNQKINLQNKPYVIIHGTYDVEKTIGAKRDDGRIHCVYAGTFDPRKGGAVAAAAGEFLDERYRIHILGFGSEKDKQSLIDTIENVNGRSKCVVSYDGLLTGDEYIKFIQSCDIGLSTQFTDARFNETSFPSKVLSYLSNGLRVVSGRIKALETSAVNDVLYYYEENSPRAIAEAIKSIDMTSPYDGRKKVEELDAEFRDRLGKIIGLGR